MNDLTKSQVDLATASRAIVKRLEEAPVFQWVLETATNDMQEAGARLDKESTGGATQEIQEDVIRQLSELIEALRKERTKPQPPSGGGGGGGGGGRQPLVPALAELKMLKLMQQDVNKRTRKIDEEVNQARDGRRELTRDQRDRLRRSAAKEGEIARITDKIATDLLNGGGGRPDAPPQEPDKKP